MFHTFLHSETVIFHHLAFVGAKIFHTMYLLLERMIWWVTCFSKESENWNGKRKEKKVKECLFLCSLSLSSLLLGHFYFAPCRNAMICGHTQISVIMCKMILVPMILSLGLPLHQYIILFKWRAPKVSKQCHCILMLLFLLKNHVLLFYPGLSQLIILPSD